MSIKSSEKQNSESKTRVSTVRFRDQEQIDTIKRYCDAADLVFGRFVGDAAENAAILGLKKAGRKKRVVTSAPGANASAL